MPEYEVNLSNRAGSLQRRIRTLAADPEMALADARATAGGGYPVLVAVHEVTLTPVLVGDAPGIPGGESGDSGAPAAPGGDPGDPGVAPEDHA